MSKNIARVMSGFLFSLALLGMSSAAHAYTYKVLHVFTGVGEDGSYPQGTPILADDGYIYGTTQMGGTSGNGVVYRIAPDGSVSFVHEFAGWQTGDGCLVKPSLTQGKHGDLYGATSNCGAYGATGSGIVYKLAPDGTETVLHSFNQYLADDGTAPFTAPILVGGSLYGVTPAGGKFTCPVTTFQCGVVYKIDRQGRFKVIHDFRENKNGFFPVGTLVVGNDGNLYGTAPASNPWNFGTVFRITPQGKFKVIYTFKDITTGGNPDSGLIKDEAGNFYGTTQRGGSNDKGTIYKVTPDGVETVLHSFSEIEGSFLQWGNLARDGDGNLYGTAYQGGTNKGGTVFQLTPGGKLNVLHNFDCNTGPCSPVSSVALDRAGNLYGTTQYGVAGQGIGVIYELVK